MKIASWNVNGIKACLRKGFLKFLSDVKPDIICCQEVKDKGNCALNTPGYFQFWNRGERPGYAGTLTLARKEPLSYTCGMGIEKFDNEGRMITLEYKDFYVVNVYVPSVHPHMHPDRPDFRREWDEALRVYIARLTKPVIIAGDFNATRAWIDSYPQNQKNEPDNPIFCSDVREGFQQLLSIGLVDAFRSLYPSKEGAYTWWGPKNRFRADNRGSRLDYFIISGELLSFVRNVKFHTDIMGSDHCPISMLFYPVAQKADMDDEALTRLWQDTDMAEMERELASKQKAIALAAFYRDWNMVKLLQGELVQSWAARVLAVQDVVETKSQRGVDGVRWETDSQKAKAAWNLTSRNYWPLPYRHTQIEEDGKLITLHVPAARDQAMQILYRYALEPVAESTADHGSFFSRKGRSLLDIHAYLIRELSGSNAPKFGLIIDIKSFFSNVMHDWLLKNIPMDSTVLRKFLKAGTVIKGELFPTEQGISYAASLSPILANMMLDGIQSYIYDRLYPSGGSPYQDGVVFRFADDIFITAKTLDRVRLIEYAVTEFLSQRGLKINYDKLKIVDVKAGFVFLSRNYQWKDGYLQSRPSSGSIKKIERELKELIYNFKGTLRTLVKKINDKLSGWGAYHKSEDAYMEFRHIDVIVEAYLLERMCKSHPRWSQESVKKQYWIKDNGYYIFALPQDRSVRVARLAPTRITPHKPCRLNFNPFLDQEYYKYLQHRREVQKANGKYRAIWTRQEGKCYYCKQRMLSDQEVDVIERVLGDGEHPNNLVYIHRQCAYDILQDSEEDKGEFEDTISLLGQHLDKAPEKDSPYIELTQYFRKSKQQTINLHFHEIEHILGDVLPWEAYCFDAFWYDDSLERTSPLWNEEGFPYQTFYFSEPDYNITHSWLSQGYTIKALHRETNRVVFRKAEKNLSQVVLPKALTERALPDEIVYKFNKLVYQFVKDNGL